MIRTIKKIFLWPLYSFIFLGVIFQAIYFSLNELPRKNQLFSNVISEWLHEPVRIQSAHLEGSILEPMITLQQVTLGASSPIQLQRLRVTLNSWQSLLSRAWVTRQIVVSGLQLRVIETPNHQFQLSEATTTQSLSVTQSWQAYLGWIFLQPDIVFLHTHVDYVALNHSAFSIHEVNLRVQNEAQEHVLTANLMVDPRSPMTARFIARASGNPFEKNNASRLSIFFQGNALQLTQLKSLISDYPQLSVLLPLRGVINVSAWVNRVNDQWQRVQTQIVSNDLSWNQMHFNALVMNAAGDVRANQWEWTAVINPLHIDPIAKMPYFPVLNAQLKMNANAGIAQIEGKDSKKNVRVYGLFRWIKQNNGWVIESPSFKYDDPHLAVLSKATLFMQQNQRPHIVVSADAKLDNVHHVLDYVSPEWLSPSLLQWLHSALIKGSLSTIHVAADGAVPLNAKDFQTFPFSIQAALSQGVVNYHAGWPTLTHLNAAITLDNHGLVVTANDAHFDHTRIQSIEARLPNFNKPILFVHAEIKNDLATVLNVVQHTPLAIGKMLSTITAHGPVSCNLELQLPLVQSAIPMSASGKINFDHDDIQLAEWKMPLKQLRGELSFQDDQFEAPHLYAQMLQQPLWISVAKKNSVIDVQANGDLEPHLLARQFDYAFLKEMHESIPFTLRFAFRPNMHGMPPLFISLGDFTLWNQYWQHLFVDIQSTASGQSIHLHNPIIAGNIFIPAEKNKPLQIMINELHWMTKSKKNNQESDADSASRKPMSPLAIPSMDVVIDRLFVNHEPDGKIVLTLRHMPTGLSIQSLSMHSPTFQLEAKGVWTYINQVMETQLSGDAESANLGKFLAQHRLSARLKNGVLLSDFSLTWPGTPQQFSIARAIGNAHVTVKDGRIMQLDSDTESNLILGRLLNLLSLETLSKFLTLDFSSLGKKGFAFDVFQGKFAMHNGVLLARETEMDGSLAKINMDGKLSLENQKNDLHMRVFPKVSSSLPMLAGIAGGPVVGAAAWVANKVFSPSVGRMMEMDYHVTGTWDKPEVKKM